jgi:NAD(P)-dependent dehydrogenase (short-subunit alcohol dehydrogenase family)
VSSDLDRQQEESPAGEVAIVTGGSHGIGRAIVELFADEGVEVMFCARGTQAGLDLERQLAGRGRVSFCPGDVASEQDVMSVVEACQERFGPPTVLVNNAGRTVNLDAVSMSLADWEEAMAVDLRSAWLLAKHVLPGMRKNGRGAIVNISSIHAFASAKGYFPYGVAKAGLLGLTRSLALDYASDNIRVNAIAPGYIDTRGLRARLDEVDDGDAVQASMAESVPLGRLGRPVEIAHTARFLVSAEASYVTGACLTVDGGLTARRAS